MGEIPVLTFSMTAGESLVVARYHAVKLSSGTIIKGTAGARCIGIVQDAPASGEIGQVMGLGLSKAVYGGSVTSNDALASDSTGKLVTATGSDSIVAVALEDGSNNEEHYVFMFPQTPGAFPAGVQGDILYYNGSSWVVLAPGTENQLFKTGGAGKNPAWANAKGKSIFCLGCDLASIADGDILTDWTPGYAGKIVGFSAAVETAATTGSKASTLHPEIGSTPTTGGEIALTSANMTPKGKTVDASAITADNEFGDTDTISIVAASTTTFIEGRVSLVLVLEETVTA